MKKLTLIILAVVLSVGTSFSQGCLPQGITFSTQAQIDNFAINHPGCSIIEGNVAISGDDIVNLNGLILLNAIYGRLYIESNPLLENLSGLNNLTMIGEDLWGWLYIYGNASLINFEGLESLTAIKGSLSVDYNPNLLNFSGLNSLTSIGDSSMVMGNLEIQSNDALTSLAGLENLISIVGDLRIGIAFNGWGAPNPTLSDISALENINNIGGNLIIVNSELLSNCAIQSICDYISTPNGSIGFENNATGCNSQQEVEEACLNVSTERIAIHDEFFIYPNPVSGFATLQFEGLPSGKVSLCIFNTTGICLKTQEFTSSGPGQQQIALNMADLPAGMYFCRIQTGNKVVTKKLIKIN